MQTQTLSEHVAQLFEMPYAKEQRARRLQAKWRAKAHRRAIDAMRTETKQDERRAATGAAP